MECKRPCYTEPKFEYTGMACFLKNNMQYYNTGMRVVVMIKDKYNPGKYKYVEKPVMYFVPNDPTNSSTVIAYVAPGHDNHYNYMYLLSKRLNGGYNVFSGDHFTMGLRNSEQFDLHYTTYDYTKTSRPAYLYYDIFIDSDVSPKSITETVCSTRINSKYQSYDNTLTERCYFFKNLMKYVHNNTVCDNQKNSKFSTIAQNTIGGKQRKCNRKQKNASQFGGDESVKIVNVEKADKPFNELIAKLEGKIGNIPNLETIEMHIMKGNKGIITYCLDEKNVTSMHISRNGVQEQVGSFMTYYSLPFDFETFEFISVEELVENLNSSIEVKKNDIRVPLDNLVLCENDSLDYKTIINMAAVPKTQLKTCRNNKMSNTLFSSVRIPVSAGGKNKKLDKAKKPKEMTSFKLA